MMRERTIDLALLSVRVGLGVLFLTFALGTFRNPDAFAKQVADSDLLASPWLELFTAGKSWWELAFGIGFLVGLATRLVGVAAFLALISYTIFLGKVANPPYPFFGLGATGNLDRNVALMFCALALAIAGAGAYSIDRLIARRRAAGVRGFSAGNSGAAGDPAR